MKDMNMMMTAIEKMREAMKMIDQAMGMYHEDEQSGNKEDFEHDQDFELGEGGYEDKKKQLLAMMGKR